MRFFSVLFAAVVLLAISASPRETEAKPRFSFLYHGKNFSIYIGPGGHRYYRPYPFARPYYYRRHFAGRCAYWSRRCGKQWGYSNRNYRGCMRYHRCW